MPPVAPAVSTGACTAIREYLMKIIEVINTWLFHTFQSVFHQLVNARAITTSVAESVSLAN